jgi:hypothetical protein
MVINNARGVCHGHVGAHGAGVVVVNADVDDAHGGAEVLQLTVDLRGLADAVGSAGAGDS